MGTITKTNEAILSLPKLNRRQRRLAAKVNHRNMVRQVIPANIKWDENTGDWIDIPGKVIFHKKKHNLPRLYPNMSKAKSRL